MIYLYLFFGFLFGYFLLQAKLNRFDTISGMATLEDFSVAKAIMLAIGLGLLLISLEVYLGVAQFHVKPLIPLAIMAGGLIFGAGMAVLGYCPGTLAISFGEGSMDALAGIVGGIAGSVVFYLTAPLLHFLYMPDFGKVTLLTITGDFNLPYLVMVLLVAYLMIWGAFRLHRLEKGKNMKWMYTGAGLAVLNGLMIMSLTLNRPVGASGVFPWLGAILTGMTDALWFEKVSSSGSWQIWFLGGAMLAGFVFSVIRREFRFRVVHSRWEKYKGSSATKRLAYAFAGGFLLLYGARMADGCTSGHVLSGGMQAAGSSYLFAIFTFTGLLLTGRFFYRKPPVQATP